MPRGIEMIDLDDFITDIENVGCQIQEDACLDIISDAITKQFKGHYLCPVARSLLAPYVFLLGTPACLEALQIAISSRGDDGMHSTMILFSEILSSWMEKGKRDLQGWTLVKGSWI